jgi:hypothetical protein
MNKEKQKSSCCQVEIKTSCADEGTCCYVCEKCGKPCDIWDDPKNKIPAKIPNQPKQNKEWEEINKIHEPVIKAMSIIEYGLLKDGDTFYEKGMELEPRSGITFTMRQAYVIAKAIREGKKIERERLISLNKTRGKGIITNEN